MTNIKRYFSLAVLAIGLSSCGESPNELKALQSFMKSKSPAVETCTYYATLVLDAHGALKPEDGPDIAEQYLINKYAARLTSSQQRDRFLVMAKGLGQIAVGLRPLAKDSAGIAYMQICRQQSQQRHGDVTSTESLVPRLNAAAKCEKDYSSGEQRKECVAEAMKSEPNGASK